MLRISDESRGLPHLSDSLTPCLKFVPIGETLSVSMALEEYAQFLGIVIVQCLLLLKIYWIKKLSLAVTSSFHTLTTLISSGSRLQKRTETDSKLEFHSLQSICTLMRERISL